MLVISLLIKHGLSFNYSEPQQVQPLGVFGRMVKLPCCSVGSSLLWILLSSSSGGRMQQLPCPSGAGERRAVLNGLEGRWAGAQMPVSDGCFVMCV